jgi:hypothetical protein
MRRGVEFAIVAGQLDTLRDVHQGIASINAGEVGIRRLAMVHVAPFIAVQDADGGVVGRDVGVALQEIRQALIGIGKAVERDHPVDARVEAPDELSAFDGFTGVNAEAFDFGGGEVAGHQHHGRAGS